MANNIPVNAIVAKKALPILRNKLPMAMNANKDYQDDISDQNARVGGNIFIRRPPRYQGRTGELMQVESTVSTSIPMQLKMAGVDVSFSQKDLQLSFDDIAKGGLDWALEPAMTRIASIIEIGGAQLFAGIANSVGTPGTIPTDPFIIGQANATIDSLGGTVGGEKLAMLDTFASQSLARNVSTLFNPNKQVSDAYMKGYVGEIGGFDTFQDPAIQSFTAGTYGGAPVVNGAGQGGLVTGQGATNTLVTSGWTATTSFLNVGDTFTIAGVFAVNPQTYQSTGKLKMFVVAQTTTTDGSGNMIITLGENGLIPSGQFQNVSNSPANGAAIVVTSGTSGQVSRQSIAYDKNAITFACVPQAKPYGGNFDYGKANDKMSGISISMTTQYDVKDNQVKTRFDVLYAWALTYPELAVRIQG